MLLTKSQINRFVLDKNGINATVVDVVSMIESGKVPVAEIRATDLHGRRKARFYRMSDIKSGVEP